MHLSIKADIEVAVNCTEISWAAWSKELLHHKGPQKLRIQHLLTLQLLPLPQFWTPKEGNVQRHKGWNNFYTPGIAGSFLGWSNKLGEGERSSERRAELQHFLKLLVAYWKDHWVRSQKTLSWKLPQISSSLWASVFSFVLREINDHKGNFEFSNSRFLFNSNQASSPWTRHVSCHAH